MGSSFILYRIGCSGADNRGPHIRRNENTLVHHVGIPETFVKEGHQKTSSHQVVSIVANETDGECLLFIPVEGRIHRLQELVGLLVGAK